MTYAIVFPIPISARSRNRNQFGSTIFRGVLPGRRFSARPEPPSARAGAMARPAENHFTVRVRDTRNPVCHSIFLPGKSKRHYCNRGGSCSYNCSVLPGEGKSCFGIIRGRLHGYTEYCRRDLRDGGIPASGNSLPKNNPFPL